MKKIGCLVLCAALLCTAVGCTGGAHFTEETAPLEGSGFAGSFHQYLWAQVYNDTGEEQTEATYEGVDVDAFFAIIRMNAEAARAQGLAGSPEILETFLETYVANYDGRNEEITAQDTGTEDVRLLEFEYGGEEPRTYRAKMVSDKESGELLLLLAACPSDSQLMQEEIGMIFDSITMREFSEADGH